jgi:hypothetical protein
VTMQVGMVGTDGVLVASDTRWMNSPQLVNAVVGARHTFSSSKIMVNHERGIAISCARNMETAQHVANGIISGSNDGTDWQYPIPPIEAIGRKVLLSAGERRDAQCLIVLMSPSPRLFLFQFAMVNGEWGPICNRWKHGHSRVTT